MHFFLPTSSGSKREVSHSKQLIPRAPPIVCATNSHRSITARSCPVPHSYLFNRDFTQRFIPVGFLDVLEFFTFPGHKFSQTFPKLRIQGIQYISSLPKDDGHPSMHVNVTYTSVKGRGRCLESPSNHGHVRWPYLQAKKGPSVRFLNQRRVHNTGDTAGEQKRWTRQATRTSINAGHTIHY